MGIPEDAICIRQPPYAVVDLYPQVDDNRAATINTTAGPGASAVTTPPQKARPESKISTLEQAATDPKTAAHLAETAVSELEDARIRFAKIDQSNATPDQRSDAGRRVVLAQRAADIAVARYVKVQTALDAKMTLALKTADAEMAKPYDKVHKNPKPDRSDVQKLAALEQKRYVALENYVQSGRSAAVAMSLRDIAKGIRPGRAELAGETGLKDAEAAKAKLDHAFKQLGLASGSGIGKIKEAVEELQKAASANRAEWAALNDNAIKSGDAQLKKTSEFGLGIAERELQFVTSPEFIRSWGL